jgi:hypothetical protein
MTTTTNTAIVATCDKLLAKLTIAANRLPTMINNAALMICENPADLAGRSIKLLDILDGTRQQKNILAFFDDYLPNKITKERGKGYVLGKKREGFTMPALDPMNLPFAYKRPVDAVEALEKKLEKAREKKAEQEQHEQAMRQAQLDEQERIERFNTMERERTNAINGAGDLRARIAELEEENAKLLARIAELEKPKATKARTKARAA